MDFSTFFHAIFKNLSELSVVANACNPSIQVMEGGLRAEV
jgi:hypothetical protein